MKWFQVLILGVTLYAGVCDALNCIVYDSATTGSVPATQPCSTTTETNCVTVFEFPATAGVDAVITKGCYTALKTKCDVLTSHCIECTGDNCNKDVPITKVKCIKCSDTDPKCVKSVTGITATEDGYFCSTTAVEQGATGSATAAADTQKVYHNKRGAINTADELKDCKNLGTKCTMCNDKAKCNVDVVPQRSICGTDICLKEADACVAFYDETGKNKREACKSENVADCTSSDTCVECTTTTACPATLTNMCYECANTADCSNKKKDQIKACATGKCFTKIEGDKSSRGCAAAADFDCKKHSCATCTGLLCNNKQVTTSKLKCYVCDASEGKCGRRLDGSLGTTACGTKTFEGLIEECYQFKKEIKRGCMAKLVTEDADKYDSCIAEDCDTCSEVGCNTLEINGSATLTGAVLLVAVTALGALFNY